MTEEVKPNRHPVESREPVGRRTWRVLLGLGFDGQDGEKRITVGKCFQLYGGSEETHEVMQEKAIKVSEHLDKRGKTLDTVERKEFDEIAHEVGLVRLKPKEE